MTTPAASSEAVAFAEPQHPVTGRWIALFATAWLGIWMAQLTPIQLLLPAQVEDALNTTEWTRNVVAFGVISGVAGLFSLIAYPLTGALSDRTTSRYGRRRPWVLVGTVLFAVSLTVLGFQTSMVGIGIFWSLSLIGFCVVSAAITATISDQVPVRQRGIVSGWVSAPQAVGTILGLVLVTLLELPTQVGYAVIAALLVLLALPFLRARDEVLSLTQRGPSITLGAVIQGFWINPVTHSDFGWTLLSRILVNLGNALGTTMLLYFIEFGLDRKATAVDDLIMLTLVYLVFFIIAALGFGRLSDKLGRRKMFVYISAYLQAIAAVILALVPDYTVAMFAAGLLGVGYGCFMSIDQALATQVLPDAHTRGKDLGIMNIATAFPQAIAPLVGALFVFVSGGFEALFFASAAFAILGGLAVMPIRSVR